MTVTFPSRESFDAFKARYVTVDETVVGEPAELEDGSVVMDYPFSESALKIIEANGGAVEAGLSEESP